MKQSILVIFSLMLASNVANAQLFSSGNNVIPGTSVGIGISTPSPLTMLHIKRTTSGSSLFLENSLSSGTNTFRMLNDNPSNFATFTKYGSAVVGGYTGISTLYPFANILGFGNNGPFLNAGTGNIGFAITKNSTNHLKLHIDANTLRVGIGGNAVPSASVHVNSSLTSDTIKITNATTGHLASDGLDILNTGIVATIMNRENSSLEFGTNNLTRLKINSDGKIVMGTTPTPAGYKLFVEEGILTEKVKVAVKTSSEWSDYVFAKEYDLKPLSEVESFINQNNHLPGVPSAQDVVDNGIDMAKMDAKLLEKIEELTLHLIEMDKKMKDLQKRLELAESK